MRFLFTCGGTAGHINPALSVAGRIRELLPDSEILFVGAKGNMESELVPREGFDFKAVTITNLRRGLSLGMVAHNLKTLKNVVGSISEAKRIIREFNPDAAIGTGGYVCYPVLRAAKALSVPTAVHESNALPGLTTKLLSGVVDKVLVGFEESRAYYKNQSKIEVTGTPVRGDFLKYSRAAARAELGVPDGKPLVVSVWGSLGADFINDQIAEFMALMRKEPFFCLIHSAGKRGYPKLIEALGRDSVSDLGATGILVREYIYDMPRVMAAADLVMCRAGASTISELQALGKPAILVPSPNVTGNHQEKNARLLEANRAARIFLEKELTAKTLLGTVAELLKSPEKLSDMSRAMKSNSHSGATDRIAEIVLELAQK